MLKIVGGIMIEVREVAFWNALLPILVTSIGIE
jgi:hypothetical protein